jgi:hypothetical protein
MKISLKKNGEEKIEKRKHHEKLPWKLMRELRKK